MTTNETEPELFTEYRYAPPNVKAVRWDGTLETARALVGFFSRASLESLHTAFSYSVEYLGEGYESVTLKMNGTTVYRGNVIVIEADNDIKILGITEFRKTYQAVDQHIIVKGEKVPLGPDKKLNTFNVEAALMDSDDYLPPDLGEHPPIDPNAFVGPTTHGTQ